MHMSFGTRLRKTIIACSLTLASLRWTSLTFAAVEDGGGGGNLNTCAPGAEEGVDLFGCFFLNRNETVRGVYNEPSTLVNLIVNNIFVFAGVIIFGLTIYSGFQFVSGGSKGIDNAKQTMTTALIGFLMMFAAYWVVQIIEAMTGVSILF